MSSQPPKDFLALSHGHEWVNFYESFDKLVQDHLSRSSELLRKAMSLPEVADREVAQIRDDLEGQLQTEKTRAAETLNGLKSDITSTQQQASSIVRMTAMMIGDLDRLAARVESAIVDLGSSPTDAVSTSAPTETTDAPDESMIHAEAESDESQQDDDGAEIDLNALAAAEGDSGVSESGETEQGNPGTGELAAASGSGESGERSRPHWLSMAKPGTGDLSH
jgi:hypothetical protein